MVLERRIDRGRRLRRRNRLLMLLLLLLRLWRHLLRHRSCRLTQAATEVVQVVKEHVDLVLQRRDVRGHILVLRRVFEASTAIGRIDTLEVQVAASLAGRLAVAFDLATLALVAV